jgi:hypothetical protein
MSPDPTVEQQGYAFELCHGEHDYRIELFFSAVPARTPGENLATSDLSMQHTPALTSRRMQQLAQTL